MLQGPHRLLVIAGSLGYFATMKSKGILIPLVFLWVTTGHAAECVSATAGLASMESETITLQADDDRRVDLMALVADDGYERASGFQHICPEVIETVLILFRYPAETAGRFHMQNVHAPLDIAFFDSQGRVVSVQRMETYTESAQPLYGPDTAFRYALEARAGFFAELGLSESGGRLIVNGD